MHAGGINNVGHTKESCCLSGSLQLLKLNSVIKNNNQLLQLLLSYKYCFKCLSVATQPLFYNATPIVCILYVSSICMYMIAYVFVLHTTNPTQPPTVVYVHVSAPPCSTTRAASHRSNPLFQIKYIIYFPPFTCGTLSAVSIMLF